MPERFIYYRVRNDTNFWACQHPCNAHPEAQCEYDINHPLQQHRCNIEMQAFFPGLQKSKQAMAANAMRKWGTQHPAFLDVEGESDFHDQ